MIYLLDASIYVFRAWFTSPEVTDAEGHPMGAAFGYGETLCRLLRQLKPNHFAVAFDESLNSCWRNELYPAYKANRELPPPELERQFAWCRAFTRALGVAEFASGRHEADDLLASLAALARRAGKPVTLITHDKDLGQLIAGKDDRLWPFPGKPPLDVAAFSERYRVRPEQMADFLALGGDAIDNIPGITGIGPRTACALLAEFDSLEDIYANLARVETLPLRGAKRIAKLLAEQREQALLSYRLAALDHAALPATLTLDALRWHGPRRAEMQPLLARVGEAKRLRRAVERLEVTPA